MVVQATQAQTVPAMTVKAALMIAVVLGAFGSAGCAQQPDVPCAPPAEGGAAPPRVWTVDDDERLRAMLANNRREPLDSESAARLKRALCDAGMWFRPMARERLAAAGIDVKRIDALAPSRPEATPQTASGALKRLPRRE